MSGGVWTSQNKVRPGAYINFVGKSQIPIKIGERGTAAITMPLSWGGEGKIINVTADDLISGNSLKKVGLVYDEEGALLLRLALANCAVLKVFNSKQGGVAASKVIGSGNNTLTATAKYPGVFGNTIAIKVTSSSGTMVVETYANGYFVDRQSVSDVSELVENDFVTFSGSGILSTTNTILTGGTDGTTINNLYQEFFNKLRNEDWNTVAVTSTISSDKTLALSYITDLRENEGRYVQAVINDGSVDNEGIINSVCGVVLEDGTEVSADKFTAWVAGATAGATLTESNTGKLVDRAVEIIDPLTNEEIIEALNAGKFVLSTNQDGTIKVEKDINSLHTFGETRSYAFSKNKVIRVLDEIGASIKNIWEKTFLGKVNNNENGRMLFRASIINYLASLQNVEAITEFKAEDVEVLPGNDIDSVVANIAIKPVDAMEILYMTINVTD